MTAFVLARLPGDLHHLHANITADTVFLVHHGCARREVLQVPQNRFRIDLGALASTFLPGTRAENSRPRKIFWAMSRYGTSENS